LQDKNTTMTPYFTIHNISPRPSVNQVMNLLASKWNERDTIKCRNGSSSSDKHKFVLWAQWEN